MKKVLCLVMALLLSASCVSVLAADYTYSQWAERDCERAINLGWISDELPKDFTRSITRGEFCSIAHFFINNFVSVHFYSMKTPFVDIGEGWGITYDIKFLYCLNIVEGKSETEFRPDDLITREEAATIMSRICNLFNKWELAEFETDAMVDIVFVDDNEISDWAKNAVYEMNALGIIIGTDKGFEPKKNLTVEETIALFVRLYDKRFDVEPSIFADKLNNEMPEDSNYMFSPLSVKMVLMLLANGADEQTQDEICDVLGVWGLEDFNEDSKKMIETYSDVNLFSMNIANSIWLNKSVTDGHFSPQFEKTAEEYYNAEAGEVTNEDAVEKINGWVMNKTNGKIESIIKSSDFAAMIINTIYFKGLWMDEFNEEYTKPGEFTNADGSVSEIDFMHQINHYRYFDDGVVRVIEMPYKIDDVEGKGDFDDLDVSMYIVLSDEEINVVDRLNNVNTINSKYVSVELYLPKFEIECDVMLKDALCAIGLESVFGAGISSVLENEALFVDEILHKTYISVDEKGTEAAAATAIALGGGKPEVPIEFKADRPFSFVIRDNKSGEVFFMGRFAYAE